MEAVHSSDGLEHVEPNSQPTDEFASAQLSFNAMFGI